MKSNCCSGVIATALLLCLVPGALAQGRSGDGVTRKTLDTRDRVVTRPLKSKSQDQPRPPRQIGLGCTLFKRGPRNTAVRINTAHEFRAGDTVRFMIESDITGYLYIFHIQNDGPAKMLFPDARLQGGSNLIRARVPREVPSSQEEDPEFRWFHFNQTVAVERFYLFVTREPLEEVPTEEELVEYCRDNPEGCPWRPSAAQWNQLLADARLAVRESASRKIGQAQTPVERDRVMRDVGLPQGAPRPAKVKMNVSPQAGMLMMNVNLIHK